jgi:drug/metabolite transporter (DMT)-like permease
VNRYATLVGSLSLLWGSSYLFIKIAGRELEPSTMMLIRVVVAGAALSAFLAAKGQLGELRRAPRGAYLLGLFNSAIPFTLIAWGERHIDSGLAAVVNASVPIFAGLLAIRWRPSERPRGIRAAGVGLGLVGVFVLTGAAPGGGWQGIAGVLAVTLASLSYGVSALYGQHLVGHVRGPVLSTTALAGALVVLLPFGIVQAPSHAPSWKALGAVVALALLGTAVAQLLWFRALRLFGAARTTLVSYLIPATALIYGVVFLSEHVSALELTGFALILAGVALGSGAVRPRMALRGGRRRAHAG